MWVGQRREDLVRDRDVELYVPRIAPWVMVGEWLNTLPVPPNRPPVVDEFVPRPPRSASPP